MSTRTILEIIGWAGSALVVLSLAQARVLRFRVMNFAGALLATVYNAALGIWPFAAMNAIISVIDAYWLLRLRREAQPSSGAYQVVEVEPDDAYLRHFLKVHADDTQQHFPAFDPAAIGERAFLVLRQDEAVGVVAIQHVQGTTARLSLDYVTPRFRDFSPGEFVYRESGLFEAMGVTEIIAPDMREDDPYPAQMGFSRRDDQWVRSVAADTTSGPTAQ